MKSIVFRTCMGCNVKKDKKELLRIVANKQNEISIDKTGKLEGRGAYLCKKEECLNKAIKNKRLEKALKTKIDEIIFNNIRGVIIDEEKQKEQC